MESASKSNKHWGEYEDLISLIELAEKSSAGVSTLESNFAKIRTRILFLFVAVYFCLGGSIYIVTRYLRGDGNDFYQISVASLSSIILIALFFMIVKDYNELRRNKAQIQVEKSILYNLLELTDSVKRKVFSEDSNTSFIDKALLQMRLKRISFNVDYKGYHKDVKITDDAFNI